MRNLRSLLLLAAFCFPLSAVAQSVGQYELRKRGASGFTSYGVTLANGQVIGLTDGIPAAITPFSGAFTDLSGKPTTLAGYGIADAITAVAAAATYEPIIGLGTLALNKLATDPLARANHTGTQAWSTITGTPTTLAGYGITDSITAALAASTYEPIIGAGTLALSKLAQGGATSGQALAWNGSAWAPATLASGITIDTAAISGGTVGRVLYHKTGNVVGELETSAGGNGSDDNGKLATYNASGNLTASQFNVQDGITSASYGPAALTFDDGAGNSTTVFITLAGSNTVTLAANTGTILTTGALGTGVATALGVNVGTAGAFVVNGGALGTPSSGTLTNCTFPTLNQDTTGSAASLSISGQTGLLTFTGLASTNREKTVRDAADTILELGGTYSPTGIWTFANTTDASSKTTGAVVISGGLGVAKTLHANVIYGYGGTNGDQLGDGILLVHPGNPNNASGVGVQIWNNWCLHWRTPNSVGLFGDLADTLWLRNSTRSQAALVANTYTSSTSYEAAGVWWAANVAYFGTQKGSGGGSARDVSLVRDSTVKFTVNANTNDHEQPAKMKVYAVGSLPAAGTVGAYSIAAVNDALAPTVGAAVAGGGAAAALVCSNGTNWIVIATL